MRYISRFKNSIRASSVYSLAFMLTFALAGSLISVEEAAAQREIELSVDPKSVVEGATETITVTATRAGDAGVDDVVTVNIPDDEDGNFTISGGGDSLTAGDEDRTIDITIASGDSTGTETFSIEVDDDQIFEAFKKLTISGEASNVFVVSTTLEIQDDDHELSISAAPSAIDEDGGAKRITVTALVTTSPVKDITIPVTIAQGSGYSLNRSSLGIDIDAGETSGTAAFEVTPVDDNVFGGDIKVEVAVGSGTDLVNRGPTSVTIKDDEKLPGLKLAVSPEEIGEGQGTRRITVTASLDDGVLLPTATRVSVSVSQNGDQYSTTASALSITIPANSSSGQTRVSITPVADNVFEADATEIEFTATATLVAGDDDSDRSASAKVSIIDDDHEVAVTVSVASIKGDVTTEVAVSANLVNPANRNLSVLVMVPTTRTGYTLASDALQDDILTIPVAANESKGTVTLTVDPADTFDDETYSPSVDIPLMVDPSSTLTGIGTMISLVDTKILPGLKLSVDDDAIGESDGATQITITATLDLMGGKAGLVDPVPVVTVVVPQDTTQYELSGGDENDDGDYVVTINNINNAGVGTTTVTFTPVENEIFEAHQKITLAASTQLVADVDGSKRSASADITLEDDDHEITLTAAPTSVKEEDGTKKITVTATLTDARRTDISVPVTISENSTFYGLSASVLMIDIDAEELSGTDSFEITPVDNSMYHGNQKVTIDVDSDRSNLVLRDMASVTVVDDESLPDLALSVDPENVAEGGGGQRVTVTAKLMDGVLLPTSTTVNVTVSEDEDQYSLSGTELAISISAGRESGTGSVTITPISDNVFEADPTKVTFTGKATLVEDLDDSKREASASVTIVDDDHQVSLSATPTKVEMGMETEVTVKATLVRPAVRDVMVSVMVPDAPGGVDGYELASENLDDNTNILSIAIVAGDTEGTTTLTVTPGSNFGPTDENYDASMDIPLNVDTSSIVAGLGTKVTIVDSKILPGLKLSVDPETIMEENDQGAAHTVQIAVTADLDLMDGKAGELRENFEVTVEVAEDEKFYEIADITDATFTITITGGTSTATSTNAFTIGPGADEIFEEHKKITLSAEATLIEGEDSTKREASADVTLMDNDHEITLTATPASVKEEDGKKKITVTATLTDARRTDITVPVAISENSTFYGLSDSAIEIDIDANETEGTDSFDITPTDNDTWNGNQKVTVSLGSGSDLVLRDTATITVVDDEKLPKLVLSTDPESVTEDGGGQRVTVTATLEEGVTLGTNTAVTVTVSENDDQYALSGTEIAISIPSGGTSGEGSVTITPIDDAIFEAGGTDVTFTAKAQLVEGVDDSKRDVSAKVNIADDDHQVTLSVSPALIEKGETKDVKVKASLIRPTPREVMVLVDVSAATADYALTSDNLDNNNVLSITIDAGDSEGEVTLNVNPADRFGPDDTNFDASVEITLDVADESVVAGLGTKIKIVDSKALPGLKLAVNEEAKSIDEGDDPAQVTATTVTVTASLDLMDDKAGLLQTNATVTVEVPADEDFYTLGNQVNADGEVSITITQGQPSGTVTFDITPGADTIFEEHKKITLKASAQLVAGDDGSKREATADITIKDDDHELSLTATPSTVKEEDGKKTVTVTATLTDDRRADITVPVTISANSTYYSLSETTLDIDIDAGDMDGRATFDITPVDNSTWNGDQKITITLDSGSDLVLRDDATVTVVDDEKLPNLVLSTDPEKVTEGGGGQRVTVTATLEEGVLLPTNTAVSVEVAEKDDQYSLSGTEIAISIPAGQESGSGSVTITPVSDNIFEASATSIGFTAKAQLVADVDDSKREASASVTIVDDDHEVTLSATPGTLKGDVTEDVTVTASLVRPAVQEVMIAVSVPATGERSGYALSVDGNALNADTFSITIDAGDSNGSTVLNVNTDADFGDANYDASVEIPLGIAASNTLAGLGTKITIVDSKTLPGLKLAASPMSFEEGDEPDNPTAQTITVTATLDLGSDGGTFNEAVTVTVEVPDDEDFYTLGNQVTDGVITFDIGANGTTGSGTFEITPEADTIFEEHKKITLKATATLVDGVDSSKREATADVTLRDDDHEVTLAVDPTSVKEEGGTKEIKVTASLTDTRRSDITIPVAISTSSYYSLSETSLEIDIDAGDLTGDETFDITPVDNATYDGNQKITVSLGGGSDLVLRDDATLTLNDDESLPTLVLSVDPSEITEGGGAQRVTVSAMLEEGVMLPTATEVSVEVGEDDDQYSLSGNKLTIMIPANGNMGQGSITVTPIDDIIFEDHMSISFKAKAQLVAGNDDSKVEASASVSLRDDDHEVSLSVAPAVFSEVGGEKDVTVTATLVRPAPQDVSIEVSLPAVADRADKYGLMSGGVTNDNLTELNIMIEAGDTSGKVTLTVTPDPNPDYTGNITISLTGRAVRGADITITDAQQVRVMLAAAPATVSESGGSEDIEVTATLTGRLVNDLEIALALGGDATEGVDYDASGLLEITVPSGSKSASATITISAVDDLDYEGNETITISGSTAGGNAVSSTIVTVLDNHEVPLASVAVSVDEINEGDGPTDVTITATLAGTSGEDIEIALSKPGTATIGEDFTVSSEQATFIVPAGSSSATKMVTITPEDDALYEGNEVINVTVTATLFGDDIGETLTADITLVDNDPAPMIALTVDVDTINEGDGATDVTITATASIASAVDIPITLSKPGTAEIGVDFMVSSEQEDFIIAEGELTATKVVTITPVDDEIYEGDEIIMVNGTVPDPEGEAEIGGSMITLTDNDSAPMVALSVDPMSISEDGGDQVVTVTATATGLSSMAIEIELAKSGMAVLGVDFEVTAATEGPFAIQPGELTAMKMLTLTPINDDIYEGDEDIIVGGTAGDMDVTPATVMLTDDETVPTVALSTDVTEVAEHGEAQDVVVTATLSGLSSMPVTVELAKSGSATKGEDYSVTGEGTITVAAGDMSGSTMLTIAPLDDQLYEGNEMIDIGGSAGEMMAEGTSITLVDDEEMPTITLTANPDMIDEGAGPTVGVVTATASGLSAMDLHVGLIPLLQQSTATLIGPGADLGIAELATNPNIAITIPAEQSSGSISLTIIPVDDDVYETNEYAVFAGNLMGTITAPVTITIVDDDAPAIALSANPTTLREDGGSQSVTFDVEMSGIAVPVPTVISLVKSGTATKGTDYVPSGNAEITIPAGGMTGSTTLSFAVMDDDAYEPSNETIVVTASWEADHHGTHDLDSVTLTIVDNFPAPAVTTAIPDMVLEAGDSRQADLSGSFSGKALTYSASSSGSEVSADVSGSSLSITANRKGAARVTVTASNAAGSASFEIGVTVTAIAAERMVYTDILAAMGRGIMSSVSNTIGGRFSVTAAERQIALANRRVDGMAAGMEAMISLSGTQESRKYGITDDTIQRNNRQPVSTRELMRGTSFYYALDDAPQGGMNGGLSFTIWGAGDWNAFEGSPSATSSYDGTLTAGYLGVDVSKTASWIAGVAVGRTMGTADYDVSVTDGTLEATLNSVYPYVHWTGPGCCIEIWGIGGFGTGEAEVSDGTSDLSMSLGMLGVRAQLVGSATGGLDLDLIGDAGITKLSTADSESASLSDLEASVQRVRIGLEGSRTSDMGNGILVTPFAQLAGRYDGGDGQTGNGLEVAGGLRIAGSRAGLEARGRFLAMHTGEEVKEHGVSVVAYVRPMGAGGQGLSMSIAPRIGADTDMSGGIWREDPMNDITRSSRSGAGVKAEIGYGLVSPMMSSILVTPFGTMDMAGEDQRRMRLGARFGSIGDASSILSFELTGERIDGNGRTTDHRIGLLGRMSF